MGGYGSTRWGHHTPRLTTGQVPRLDVVQVATVPPGGSLTGTWGNPDNPARMHATRDEIGLRVRYSVQISRGQGAFRVVELDLDVDEHIEIAGKQYCLYLLCPRCGKARNSLYFGTRGRYAGRFRCRVCHNLAYASSQESRKPGAHLWVICAQAALEHGGDPRTMMRHFMSWRHRTVPVKRARERGAAHGGALRREGDQDETCAP